MQIKILFLLKNLVISKNTLPLHHETIIGQSRRQYHRHPLYLYRHSYYRRMEVLSQ